jgi:hypothetical protein
MLLKALILDCFCGSTFKEFWSKELGKLLATFLFLKSNPVLIQERPCFAIEYEPLKAKIIIRLRLLMHR